MRDAAGQFLAVVVRLLPESRADWGAAMVAELAQLNDPGERWRFAMSCARVAISPLNPGVAAFLGVILATPVAAFLGIAYFGIQPLEGYLRDWLMEPDGMRQRVSGLVAILGSCLMLPVGSLIAVLPVARSVRAGQGFGANPINLAVGLMTMSGFVFLLAGFVIDQMPCWLNAPNCD